MPCSAQLWLRFSLLLSALQLYDSMAMLLQSYSAMRKVVECLCESLPQIALQLRMKAMDEDLLGDRNDLLHQALITSLGNFLFVAALSVYEMRRRNMNASQYFVMLIQVGGGKVGNLAKRLARNDPQISVVALRSSDISDAHLRMLLQSLKKNTVVTGIELGNTDGLDVNLRLQLEFEATARDPKPFGRTRTWAERIADDDPLLPTTLNFSGRNLRIEHVRMLADALRTNTRVTSVDITNNEWIVHAGLAALRDMLRVNTTIQQIRLDNGFVELEFKSIFEDPQRRSLTERITDNDPLLPRHLYLQDMALDYTDVKALGIALKENSSIESLFLSGSHMTNHSFAALGIALKENNSIKTLTLSNCNLNDIGVILLTKPLRENKCLVRLDLSDNEDITDTGAEDLADMLSQNISIRDINIKGCTGVSMLLRIFIFGRSRSETLNVRAMQISDKHLEVLAARLKINNVTSFIDLRDNLEITDAGGQALLDMLDSNNSIRRIVTWNAAGENTTGLSDKMANEIRRRATDTSRWLRPLCERIASNCPMVPTKLDLRGIDGLTDAAIEQLAEALKTNKGISVLNLRENKGVTDVGGRALLDMLGVNTALRSCILGIRSLGYNTTKLSSSLARRIERLAEDPQRRTIIERVADDDPALPRALSLRGWGLEDDDVLALADAIKTNTRVTELDLRANNRMTDTGMAALCAALRDNVHITTLDLRKTRITDGQKLEEMLESNSTLRKLLLQNTAIPEGVAKELEGRATDPDRWLPRLEARIARGDETLPDRLNLSQLVSDEDVAVLAAALETNEIIVDVDLGHCEGVTEASAQPLLKMLRANATIRRVTLKATGMGSQGVVQEIERLAKDPNRWLPGLRARLAANDPTLSTKLDLRGMGMDMTHEKLLSLVTALMSNKRVSALDFRGNKWNAKEGQLVGRALIDLLHVNSTIRRIKLTDRYGVKTVSDDLRKELVRLAEDPGRWGLVPFCEKCRTTKSKKPVKRAASILLGLGGEDELDRPVAKGPAVDEQQQSIRGSRRRSTRAVDDLGSNRASSRRSTRRDSTSSTNSVSSVARRLEAFKVQHPSWKDKLGDGGGKKKRKGKSARHRHSHKHKHASAHSHKHKHKGTHKRTASHRVAPLETVSEPRNNNSRAHEKFARAVRKLHGVTALRLLALSPEERRLRTGAVSFLRLQPRTTPKTETTDVQ